MPRLGARGFVPLGECTRYPSASLRGPDGPGCPGARQGHFASSMPRLKALAPPRPGRKPSDPMCTVVLLIRPGHAWPLILAANRDELLDRPWDPPARALARSTGRDRRARPLGRRHLDGREPARRGGGGAEPAGQPRARPPASAAAANCRCSRWRTARPREAPPPIAALDAGVWRSFNLVLADRRRRGLRPRPRPRSSRGAAARARPAHGHRARPGRPGQPARRAASGAVPGGCATRPTGTTGATGRTSWPTAPASRANRSMSCPVAASARSARPCWPCRRPARRSGCSPPARRTRRRSSPSPGRLTRRGVAAQPMRCYIRSHPARRPGR